MKKEQNRYIEEDLTEDELEIYDLLLIKNKSLTKEEIKKVKLAAKNLYHKLSESRDTLLVVDWYKDGNMKETLKRVVQDSLDRDLPEIYSKELFQAKTNILMDVFIDKSVQGLKVA